MPTKPKPTCPHCGETLTEAQMKIFAKYLGAVYARKRVNRMPGPGRSPILAKCKYCKRTLSTTDRRRHEAAQRRGESCPKTDPPRKNSK